MQVSFLIDGENLTIHAATQVFSIFFDLIDMHNRFLVF
jgi:hypothetical protein